MCSGSMCRGGRLCGVDNPVPDLVVVGSAKAKKVDRDQAVMRPATANVFLPKTPVYPIFSFFRRYLLPAILSFTQLILAQASLDT